ncbi:MAG: flotillin-like protein FloA [Planctomycetota bacterium]
MISLAQQSGSYVWLIVGLLLLVLLIGAILFLKFFNLWIQAQLSRTKISLFSLIGMWLRKVNPTVVTRAMISATQAGVPLETREVEAHYLAGGNVINVVQALIAADRANLGLDFRRAAAIDLAGRDVLEAVRTCVNPKVIDCPPDVSRKVAAMAKNGIQVLARARVTVRTNIERLIGGATEETIIARVGEGIVSSIGSSESHKDVLENPDAISKKVLGRGLHSGTAFEILSIDIADVDVGDNIGARLQAEQAEADKRIAQAAAEGRRAMAVAAEQENAAEVMQNRAKLVLAEAEVPKAMADAFRSGNLGVFDYFKLKNVESDTKMRSQIAAGEEQQVEEDRDRGKVPRKRTDD